MTSKHQATPKKAVFLYAAGVVAPQAADLNEFINKIKKGESTLTPKESFYGAVLAGCPKFDFSKYKGWLEERYGPKRFSQLAEKGSDLVLYGLGSTIDALETLPGLENAIKKCDPRVLLVSATGLADLPSILHGGATYQETRNRWNAFWADTTRCSARAEYEAGQTTLTPPTDPKKFDIDSYDRVVALLKWNEFWCSHSSLMHQFLKELEEIETVGLTTREIETGKLTLIRSKSKAKRDLYEKYGNPPAPWEGTSPNMLWNIPNLAASQISMNLGLHGNTYGVAGACASFPLGLDHALSEIQNDRADAAIVTCVDPTPSDEIISSFYNGKLAVLGKKQGVPFTDLRGTHISGGACTWILSTKEVMEPLGVHPHKNIEILSSRISADGEHIITPSKEGPKLAVRQAFQDADVTRNDIDYWDMHATGTPGDINELKLIDEFIHADTIISGRKGLLGHAMGASGGLELTALLYGMDIEKTKNEGQTELSVTMPGAGIDPKSVHPLVHDMNKKMVLNQPVTTNFHRDSFVVGKLTMGVGGISGCTIIRVTPE